MDLYFRRNGVATYTRIATVAAAAGSGTFRRTVEATYSGTYKAVYRGNEHRKPATRDDGLAVHVTETVTRTVFSHASGEVDCFAESQPCFVQSAETTIADGPLMVTFHATCRQPKSGRAVAAFTDSPDNTPPPFAAGYPASPGWRHFPYGMGPGEFDLAPDITHGHFVVGQFPLLARSGNLRFHLHRHPAGDEQGPRLTAPCRSRRSGRHRP